MGDKLTAAVAGLYRKVSTELPADVIEALKNAKNNEDKDSAAFNAIGLILKNTEAAKNGSTAVCQDTGMPTFYVYYPKGSLITKIKKSIIDATKIATEKGHLRPNAVNSITGKNTGNGAGNNIPIINFAEWGNNFLRMELILKGGGSENVSCQYSLPDERLNAGRDLNGIKKCVIDAVQKAQGLGCPPSIIGVGIGGDRANSYKLAKEQLFRKLNDYNKDEVLAKLEGELCKKLNSLGIGPMGLGGKTTVLSVKIGAVDRIPASFFVSIAYMCWAARRGSLIIRGNAVKYD